MNPLVWGPPFWFVMHTVSLNYPVQPTYAQRRTHYDFFYNIRNILPCEKCRHHYRVLLKQYPIEPFLDSRDALISWVILIHNQVNVQLGKSTMSKDAVMQKYNKAYTNQSFCQLAETDDSDHDVDGTSSRTHLLRQASKHASRPPSGRWRTVLWVILCVLVVACVVGVLWRMRATPA